MKVLSLGAHPDDIELGCGGTIVRHVARGDEVTILVMTSGGRGTLDGMSRLYETPSTRRFDPSVYIDVSTALDAKLESLRAHLSQVLRAGPVDLEAIEAQPASAGHRAGCASPRRSSPRASRGTSAPRPRSHRSCRSTQHGPSRRRSTPSADIGRLTSGA